MKKLQTIFFLTLFFLTMKAIAQPPDTPLDLIAPIPICSGNSATVTLIPDGAADGYYWVATGPSWSFESTTTSSTFNILTAGPESGTISVWAFNLAGNSNTFTKVFEQMGDIGTINVPGGFHCTGTSKTYTVDPVLLADSYTWQITGSGWTLDNTSSTWTEVTAGTGDATLRVWASNTCESSATISTTIIPKPVPEEIFALTPGPHCPGTANTYYIDPVPGALWYSWFLVSDDPGWTAPSSTTTDFVVSSGTMTTGPCTVYVASNNICGSSATISRVIAPYGGPTDIIATPPGGHCNNSTKTYSVAPVEHATSYGWKLTGNSEWSASSSTTSAIDVTSGTLTLTSCTLSVWAVNDCGTSSTFSKVIPPLYTPSSPLAINKPATHCYGALAVYSVSPVIGATNYVWSSSNGSWLITGTTNSVNITAGTGSTTITVAAVNNCGVSLPINTTASAWFSPSSPTITTPGYHCAGTTASYTVNTDLYASDYTWYVSGAGWSGTSTTNVIDITAGLSSGTISVVANGYCASSTTVTTVMSPLVIPPKPERIYFPPSHCEGEIKTYACSDVPGATSYTWAIVGTGWTGASTTNYIDLEAGASTALITVRANSICGSSDTTSMYYTPMRTPTAPSSLSKPSRHCEGTIKTYSISSVLSATDYHWAIINASGAITPWTMSALSKRDVNLTAGSTSATITIFASNSCGNGAIYSEVLTPHKVPGMPGIVTEPDQHCEGSVEEYSISPVTGATSYMWSVSGVGWTAASSTTKECNFTAGAGPGIISVRAVNDCGTGTVRTLTVTPMKLPNAPAQITVPAVHCQGATETYTASPVTGAISYVWTVTGNNWTGTSTTTPTINITAGIGTATITARAINECGQGPVTTVTSTAIPRPSSEFSINRDTICRDESITVTYTGGAGTGATYAWNFDGGTATPGSGKGPHSVMWYNNPGTRTIRLIVTENGCPSQERLVSVFVDNCLGVNDNQTGLVKMQLMPNPSQGNVTLRLENCPNNTAEVQIVNMLGQKLYSEQLTNISELYTKELNLNSYESGSYYVKLVLKDMEIVRRLVIIK
ncbi:MAG: T9SS type A sorting domain-containing protein [bacterium]